MKDNDYLKSYGFLGLGAFGGNLVKLFEAQGYPTIAANSSTEDLAQLTNIKNKIHFDGGQGCHKDRTKSKELLCDNIDSLIEAIKTDMPQVTTLFIAGSAGGGTGSGMLAATAEILKNQLNKNIAIITALPSKSEQLKAYANTIELFRELEQLEDMGATFILDNDKYHDKLEINAIFNSQLDSFLRGQNGSEVGVVDRAEIEEMLKTNGLAVISKIESDNANTNNVITSLTTNNIYAKLESDKVLKYFCLLSCTNKIDTSEVFNHIGEPQDSYIGFGADNITCMIAGLSYPKTRLNEIYTKAKTNATIIKQNKESAGQSLFDDDTDLLSMFDAKPAPKEVKKMSTRDMMNKYFKK